MDDKKTAMLADAMRCNASIEKLVVSRNPLGPDNVAVLCAGILDGMRARVELQQDVSGVRDLLSPAATSPATAAWSSRPNTADSRPATAGSGTAVDMRRRGRRDRILSWRGLQSLVLADTEVSAQHFVSSATGTPACWQPKHRAVARQCRRQHGCV